MNLMEIVQSFLFLMTQGRKDQQAARSPTIVQIKRIYVEGDPTEIVISWAMLFA